MIELAAARVAERRGRPAAGAGDGPPQSTLDRPEQVHSIDAPVGVDHDDQPEGSRLVIRQAAASARSVGQEVVQRVGVDHGREGLAGLQGQDPCR